MISTHVVIRATADHTFTNGATVNTWTITTQCNAEVTCDGLELHRDGRGDQQTDR